MQIFKLGNFKTNHLIMICLVALVIVVVPALIIGINLGSQLSFNNRVLSKKTAAKKQLEANIAALPALRSSYNDLGGKEKLIMRSLPTRPDYPALATSMQLLTGVSGIKLNSVSPPGPGVSAEGPIATDFTIEGEGSYANILRLLSNLQLSARPLRINAVSVSGTGSSMSIQAHLTTYYQAAKSITPKTEVVK